MTFRVFFQSLNYSVIHMKRGTLLLSRKAVVDESEMRRQELTASGDRHGGERLERGKILELPFRGVNKFRSARTNFSCRVYLSIFWPSSRFSSLTYRALVEMYKCFQSAAIVSHIKYQSRMYLPRADDAFYRCEIQ